MNSVIKSKLNIKKINMVLIISLIPLLITGFYKNGIKLYNLGYVNFVGMLKPLIIDILGLLLGVLVNLIYEKIIKKQKININNLIFESFYPFYGLLISSLISINTPYYLFIIITFLILLLSKFIKKKKINYVALAILIIILIMNFTTGFSYLNIYEQSNILHLEPLDYFLGLGSGGINTCNILFLTISIIILFKEDFYKKDISIVSIITYLLFIIFYGIYKQDIVLVLNSIFSNGILFSFIYVAPIFEYSPVSTKGKIIYSILIGIITFILYLVYPALAGLGGILLASLCTKYIDKIF